MATRGASGHSLLLAVDKPVGMTSHDVVNRVRRALGERRVGHFGTLDPLASGVMLVGVGPAARLDKYLVEHDKTYVADIVFGQERNTDDAEGVPTSEAPVPPEVGERAFAEEVLARFTGKITQTPPQFSAIKKDGATAYVRARAGETVELDVREVEVYDSELLTAADGCWKVRFHVSKGTYIRALARDIGREVGCGAYLGGLRREKLGDVGPEACMTLEELEQEAPLRVLDPVQLLGFSHIELLEAQRKALMNGGTLPVPASELPASYRGLVSVVCDNRLKAIYRADEGPNMTCDCMFSIGVSRG